MLRLPAYQELSEEQDDVYDMILKGNHLVIGPPGSGKTVMALYRAEVLSRLAKRAKYPYTFLLLVYNRPLEKYLQQAAQRLRIQNATKTFHKWMWRWYRENFGPPPPTLPGESFMPDWGRILPNVANKEDIEKLDHLLVDEGQDLPREFYILAQLVAKNVTVFADENQSINPWNSTIEQIQRYLRVSADKVFRLSRNYRNTRPIAEFAKEFYTGLRSGIPDLPLRAGPLPFVVGIRIGARQARNAVEVGLGAQLDYIVRYYKAHRQERIGVAVPTHEQQKKLLRGLIQRDVENLHNIGTDQVDFETLDFGKDRVTLLRFGHAKGLEFDAMFLPDLDGWHSDADRDTNRMLFYVLTSRAREQLHMLFTGETLPSILTCVPRSLYQFRQQEVD